MLIMFSIILKSTCIIISYSAKLSNFLKESLMSLLLNHLRALGKFSLFIFTPLFTAIFVNSIINKSKN